MREFVADLALSLSRSGPALEGVFAEISAKDQ